MAYIDTKYLGNCETCRHLTSGGCNTYCDHGEEYSPNLLKIPVADVVPKSEEQHGVSFYFQLEEIQERGKQLMREHDAEVAREIFAEIERTCVDSFGCFYIGATHGAFAELKKKYTEATNG